MSARSSFGKHALCHSTVDDSFAPGIGNRLDDWANRDLNFGAIVARSPDLRYRTAPLTGLWTHTKGGFYHDGRFATLLDVVNHYNTLLPEVELTEAEKLDLVEYLKSLGSPEP